MIGFKKILSPFLRKLFYKLSPNQRFRLRKLIYLPEKIFSKREDMVPPKGMIFTGGGDFIQQGNNFLKYFTQLGKLNSDDQVLEIGCGIGRMARPLTHFLSNKGTYTGFDIVQSGIDWCKINIEKKYPNFNFHHFSLENKLYSIENSIKSKDFKFPFPDQKFNFCIATSVFTHMTPEDTSRYFAETSRVLKSGGNCFFTFFIIDEKSRAAMVNSDFYFQFQADGVYYLNLKLKEANVAYPINFIEKLCNIHGFKMLHFYPGDWSTRTDQTLDFQDILILQKI